MQQAGFHKNRLASSFSSGNTYCFLFANCIRQWGHIAHFNRPDRTKLWIHIFCSCINHIRAVWSKQCQHQPQHSHHQHSHWINPLRTSCCSSVWWQCRKFNPGKLVARSISVHGKAMLSEDIYMVGMHFLVRPSFQFCTFPEDQACLLQVWKEPKLDTIFLAYTHNAKLCT